MDQETKPTYSIDEGQKATLMAPMLKAMRAEVLKQELFDEIESQVPNPHPTLAEEKVTEQITFGMLAHVKYGLEVPECVTLVNDGQAVHWCFDRFFNSDDFKAATEQMNTIDMDGVSVSHNIDTDNLEQVARVIQPVIERFNKDLKNSPVVYAKANFFNIRMKQERQKQMASLTQADMFQAGCACILFRYYGVEQDTALQLALNAEAAKSVLEKHLKEAVTDKLSANKEVAEETVTH